VNEETISKVWTALATIAIIYSFDGVLNIQSAAFHSLSIGAAGAVHDRNGATTALVAFIVASVFNLLALYVCGEFAERRLGKAHWEDRWPVAFGVTLSESSSASLVTDPLSRRYQWVTALVALGMTNVAIALCFVRILDAELWLGGSAKDMPWYQTWSWSETPRLESADGFQFFGAYEGFSLITIAVVQLLLLLRLMRRLSRRASPNR
jgi:hypothetical protein